MGKQELCRGTEVIFSVENAGKDLPSKEIREKLIVFFQSFLSINVTKHVSGKNQGMLIR